MNRKNIGSEGRGCQQGNGPDCRKGRGCQQDNGPGSRKGNDCQQGNGPGDQTGSAEVWEQSGEGDRQHWNSDSDCIRSGSAGKSGATGLLIAFFVLLVHGSRLGSRIIGIDTEDIIRLQGDFYEGWLISGRQGLVLLKRLLGNYQFNPYYTGVMTLLFLWGAVMAFLKLWDLAAGYKSGSDGKKRWGMEAAWLTGAFLWISHPVLAEQFYFTLQSMEICAGFLLTALALYLIMCAADRHIRRNSKAPGILLWLAGTLLAMLTFTIYQAFVVFYIFGALSVMLLEIQRAIWNGEEPGFRQFALRILPWAAGFATAFTGGSLVGTVLCGKGDYLTSQIQWGDVPFSQNILRILKHVAGVLTGFDSVYYHFVFGFLCLAAIMLSLVFLIRRGAGLWPGFLWLIMLLALMSTPFWMTVLCGGAPVIRSQLILPAVTGYLAYYTIRLSARLLSGQEGLQGVGKDRVFPGLGMDKVFSWAVTAICAAGILGQSQVTLRLYYTDACRYEQDAALGRELIQAVEKEARGERYPVVTIGSRPFAPNHACLVGETIGHSFFDHDTQVEPAMYWSSRRVIGFFHTLGYNAAHATPEMTQQALQNSMEMPVWPEDGSVRLVDGVIVIKLSEP